MTQSLIERVTRSSTRGVFEMHLVDEKKKDGEYRCASADRAVNMRTAVRGVCRRMIDQLFVQRPYFTFSLSLSLSRFVLQMKISSAVYVTIDACYTEQFDYGKAHSEERESGEAYDTRAVSI